MTLQVLSNADHQQDVIDYLCSLLLKYRLFSSEDEQTFQAEVAKRLVASENPKAAKAIARVLKRWTVPAQVKRMIEEEIEALNEERTEVDA